MITQRSGIPIHFVIWASVTRFEPVHERRFFSTNNNHPYVYKPLYLAYTQTIIISVRPLSRPRLNLEAAYPRRSRSDPPALSFFPFRFTSRLLFLSSSSLHFRHKTYPYPQKGITPYPQRSYSTQSTLLLIHVLAQPECVFCIHIAYSVLPVILLVTTLYHTP